MAEDKNKTQEQEKEEKKFENKVTIQDSGPCKRKIIVEVPEEAIKTELKDRYSELQREAVVPGFRKGRAPLRLIEKRFGSDVSNQVKLKLLADASDTAIMDNEIDMLGDPDIDYENIELPESGPMEFEFEVEVRPEFKLPNLEGIDIEKPKIEITDQQLDEEITTMRQRAGIWTPKEDAVEEGDQIIADAHLDIEGVEEDKKHDNIEIFARENGFVGGIPVENLNKLLVGSKPGNEKSTSVEVPKTYFNEEYRGKKVDIKISVKEVKKLEPAELNEDFFRRFNVNSENELRDMLKESRSSQAEQQARTAMGQQVFNYLLENTDFDLPGDIVADQSMRILQRQYTNLLMQGLPKEDVDQRMEQLRASSEDQAKEQLKLLFIMSKVAEELKVEVSEEEINGYIAQVAANRGRRPEKMKEELARDGSLAQFSMQIREEKCIEKILEKANITDVEPKKMKKKAKQKAKKTEKKAKEKSDKKAIKKTVKKEDKKTTKKTEAKKTTKKKQISRESTTAKRKKKTSKKATKKEK